MDFIQEWDALFESLGESSKMALATCSQNRPTARMMSCIISNQRFYLQTDKMFTKYAQIAENPRAALCVNNIQIEGQCRILGHPLAKENIAFAKLFQTRCPSSFAKYTHLENEVLIRITPRLITLWCYDEGKPYRKFLDFVQHTATLARYDISH